jgi:hypothetical protein
LAIPQASCRRLVVSSTNPFIPCKNKWIGQQFLELVDRLPVSDLAKKFVPRGLAMLKNLLKQSFLTFLLAALSVIAGMPLMTSPFMASGFRTAVQTCSYP